jgi:hypothetical protein
MSQLAGVSSSIQTQLNAKQNKLTQAANAGTNVTITDATGKIDVTIPALNGAISEITSADLTVNKALISDGSGKVNVSAVTSTELGYLGGVTSGIQTQINNKQDKLTTAQTDALTELASGGGEWKTVPRDDSLPVWDGSAVQTDLAHMYGTDGIYTTVDKLLEQATKHGNIATGDFYIKCRSTYMTGTGTTRTINESIFYLVFYENKLLHYTVVYTAALKFDGTHTIKTDFYSTNKLYKTWSVAWYYGNATFSYNQIQTDRTYSYANIKIRTMTQQDMNATDFAIYFIGEPNVNGNVLYVS